MDMQTANVNRSTAPLKNVVNMMVLIDAMRSRDQHSSSLAVFSGPSGYGKSFAARYAQNYTQGIYVEVKFGWTRKIFLTSLLIELGENNPRGTCGDMYLEIVKRLGSDPMRPLIIDEADYLLDKGLVEYARDFGDSAGVPVILIGEEKLPSKLALIEKVDNRVLERVLAVPCDLDDAKTLARLLCPKLDLSDGLLQQFLDKTKGRTQRLVNTLNDVRKFARRSGTDTLDVETYQGPIDTAHVPVRSAK
ncbi:ATP-binding protein [Aurantimonas sp. 22II-16-19i]|uniref:AAA family ATPase n=1 Tax=Aurantimonas sp. 22II-16-19i TaxID=1317114 RepID=UPI0009F88C04|nr:ATP-binding protein [Aurantimonas sp. 22II-16-19i]